VILIAICFADLISTVQMLKGGNFKEWNIYYFIFIDHAGIAGFAINKALMNLSCISMIAASIQYNKLNNVVHKDKLKTYFRFAILAYLLIYFTGILIHFR